MCLFCVVHLYIGQKDLKFDKDQRKVQITPYVENEQPGTSLLSSSLKLMEDLLPETQNMQQIKIYQ